MPNNKIHQTHFTVPELPYKKMEREAILLLKRVLLIHEAHKDCITECALFDQLNDALFRENKDLVDWVMKYKGE